MRRWMIALAVALVAILGAMGLLLDAKAFLVNLVVAIISIVASVAVALSIVNRYVQRRAAEQWAKVRDVTYRGDLQQRDGAHRKHGREGPDAPLRCASLLLVSALRRRAGVDAVSHLLSVTPVL